MAKPDVSAYEDFDQICDRLDEIAAQVRSKDTSLERSLDLFDEAIALGSKAVNMVDASDIIAQTEAKQPEAQPDGRDEAQQGAPRPQGGQPSGRGRRKKRGRRR